MSRNTLNYRLINFTAFMVFLYITVSNIGLWWGILTKCISIMAPFIVGFLFAYAFTPIVNLLVNKGLKRGLANLVVIFLLIILVSLFLVITLPVIYDQLVLFIKAIITVMNNLGNKFNINILDYEIEISGYLNDLLKEVSSIASTTTMGIILKSFDFMGKFIVGFVSFIYFLCDMNKIRNGFKVILKKWNKKYFNYIKVMDNEITNYLKGLEIFMLIQLFEYGLLFFIIGHPNWLILGILACITTVIPYFGGLITNIIAIILASTISVPLTIATVVICLIFPQIDGYIISPRIYGSVTKVNPLIVIMVVSVGGTIAGPFGIILALPCFLLIRATYQFFRSDLKKGMIIVKETI